MKQICYDVYLLGENSFQNECQYYHIESLANNEEHWQTQKSTKLEAKYLNHYAKPNEMSCEAEKKYQQMTEGNTRLRRLQRAKDVKDTKKDTGKEKEAQRHKIKR